MTTWPINEPGLGPDLTPEQQTGIMRSIRDRLLAASDWTQLPDAPVDKTAWAIYRQNLRDFPSTWTPGPTADFPDSPA
ncbi:MAG: hypothetical protein EBR30_25515 [Cytophagia bacterium]|nr:hypothetical protein [Cytophagia bacterium]